MGWWWRKRNNKKRTLEKLILKRGAKLLEDLIEFGHGISNPIKFFSADEILKATNNFSDSNYVTGLNSPFYWYSGKNENHPMILIKIDLGLRSERHFCRDIAVSSMVSGHKNFWKLVGCCLELEKPVLVYNGVKKHYQLDISEQPWKRRMKIAEDIATALAYLHTAFPRPFVYRNIHPWNILLDEDGVAKLIDFSLCVSIPEGETFVKVDKEHGFYSYMYDYDKDNSSDDSGIRLDRVVSEKTDVFVSEKTDEDGVAKLIDFTYCVSIPEGETFVKVDGEVVTYSYLYDYDNSSGGVVSEKTDVFAFGKFMGLTLLLGKEIFWELDGSLRSKLKEDGGMEEIADPKMIEKMGQISEQELCQMEAFRMLSLRCISPREEVPTMVEVAKELKKIQRSLNM